MSPAGGGRTAVRTCGATTGFFVLTRCDRNARAGCTRCTRSVCARHVMHLPGDPATVCPECYAAARGYVSDPNDDDWVTGYRHSFYWEMSSSTSDDTWWQIFDDVDRAAFDADERGEHAGDEREGEDMGEYDADGPYSEYGDDADDDGFVDS